MPLNLIYLATGLLVIAILSIILRITVLSGRGRGAGPEDEAANHATLLVSELALYNRPELDRAREERNIIPSLREDIERAQAKFDKRCGPLDPGSPDYFRQALVTILAEGDEGALGE